MNTILKPLAAALAAIALVGAPIGAAAAHGGGSGAMGSMGGGGGGGWRGGSSGGGYSGGYYRGGYNGGYYRGGYYRGGYYGGYWPYWGAVGLGLGLAIGYGAYGYGYGYPGYVGYPGYAAYPGYVVDDGSYAGYAGVDPSSSPPPVRSSSQPVPAASHMPDPIFYPRNGQSPAKTETDRQECNRWATTQAGAMNDASIFQRATLACMDGRGYTAR
jgi:hypothetical protein